LSPSNLAPRIEIPGFASPGEKESLMFFQPVEQSVRGYAAAYRNGERISTAHVESTVNQLINWRMCKKHQMGWSRAGAQQLLHVKTAILNGRLDRYTGHHSIPEDIAA
jgi:hypothetical protein